MNLAVFKEKVVQNPWNNMDEKAGRDFIKARRQQVKNWREEIYKDIKDRYDKEPEKIENDYFEGDITKETKDKKEEKSTTSA